MTFKNHASGAPVVWLVEGSVVIEGIVELNGGDGHDWTDARTYAEPGPGGFRGGRGSDTDGSGSGGFGPGGAGAGATNNRGSGGSYAEIGGQGYPNGGLPGPSYGNSRVLPLIGGSGGSGGNQGSAAAGGGAGGGAILIAANSSILLNGAVLARGGDAGVTNGSHGGGGGGSGGGIRLIADTVWGSGELRATPRGNGAVGRIRVEAAPNDLTDLGLPPYTTGSPEPVTLWPDETLAAITSVSLAGAVISPDPKRGLSFPNQEVFMSDSEQVALFIEAVNVPITEGDAEMVVRVLLKSGLDFTANAVYLNGTFETSTWQADLVMPGEILAIQVRVELP